MDSNKETIIAALFNWVAQRPGLEWANYGDAKLYRAEMRRITRQRHDAETLIRFVYRADSIPADAIMAELNGAGRLSWDGDHLDYCTGQYWPTEYRAAVCCLLSTVLWRWFREQCGCDTREKIHAAAVREFGKPIAKRWFN